MRLAFCAIAGASLALAACSQEKEQPTEESTVQADAEEASDTPEEADSGLREWLVGTWSYDGTCASDFAVFYNADGTMRNEGESGTWEVAGNTLRETITQEFEMGEPGSTKVDPPRVRELQIEMVDETTGNLISEGDTYPITRC